MNLVIDVLRSNPATFGNVLSEFGPVVEIGPVMGPSL